MPGEQSHQGGQDAVLFTKRWLESSTYIELPWNAYYSAAMCQVRCLDGSKKGFDLGGLFLDDKGFIYVENKGVTTSGDQHQEYRKFLAIAYSSTAQNIKEGADRRATYIWVTTYPFVRALRDWKALETHGAIKAALKEFPQLLGGESIDEDLLRLVASRVWVLLLNRKQSRLFLTADEVTRVHGVLNRKDGGL